jgi:hypothetical protein
MKKMITEQNSKSDRKSIHVDCLFERDRQKKVSKMKKWSCEGAFLSFIYENTTNNCLYGHKG